MRCARLATDRYLELPKELRMEVLKDLFGFFLLNAEKRTERNLKSCAADIHKLQGPDHNALPV